MTTPASFTASLSLFTLRQLNITSSATYVSSYLHSHTSATVNSTFNRPLKHF